MNDLIEFLKENNVHYDVGIINNNTFVKLPKPFENEQAIRFKWKKSSTDNLQKKLKRKNINLTEISSNSYACLYNIDGTKDKILIIYAVDSHVQLPKTLLKNFRTDYYLYYINTSSNKISRSSARRYNTEFGYYPLHFEEYLSKNYESIIADIINTILPFANKEKSTITFTNLNKKINKLFLMSLFRNPKYVEEINNYSIFPQIIDCGYDSEYLAYIEEEINRNFIKGYVPVVLINETNKGMVTTKSFVSDLKVDGGINCMIIPLHPKFAITLVSDEYYKKMINEQGEQTYLKLNDDNYLCELNKQIYYCAKHNKDDVIGLKDDLDELIEMIEIYKK